jgi:hypothetical protein
MDLEWDPWKELGIDEPARELTLGGEDEIRRHTFLLLSLEIQLRRESAKLMRD